ncbi:MAG: hypothetical protein IIC99_07640, partial [Chloroflexi bacterium]|nr:hypothetical protein [Chloroflexota bacterium]
MINGNHDQNETDSALESGGLAPSKETAKAGLLAYLAQLGLSDAGLAKVLSLIPESGAAPSADREDLMADGRLNSRLREDLLEALHGADLLEEAPRQETVEEPIKESVEETATGTAPP